MFEQLIKVKAKLENINKNLRKGGPNRVYKVSSLNKKLHEVEKLRHDFVTLYTQYFIAVKFKDQILLKETNRTFLELVNDSRLRINNLLLIAVDSDSDDENVPTDENRVVIQTDIKMEFEFKTAVQIIPDFSGESDKVTDFIDAVEYYNNSLKDENNKKKLLEFVLKIKLKGKAKNLLSSTPKSFTELQKIVTDRFKPKLTLTNIHADLNTAKQGNKSVSTYASEIESLITEMSKINITSVGEAARDTILKLNDKQALNFFKNGLNNNLKTVVMASRADSFTTAVEVALEAEASQPPQTNVFSVRRGNSRNAPRNFRSNHNNYSYRQNHSRGSRGGNTNYNYVPPRQNFFRNQNGQNSTYRRPVGRTFYRGQNSSRGQFTRPNTNNVHYCNQQSENGLDQLSQAQTPLRELGKN